MISDPAVAAQLSMGRSFEQPVITIGGLLARNLSGTGASDYIIRGGEIVAKAQEQ